MELKVPKNTDRFEWTMHVVSKMKQYNLSENRVKRVINNPKRTEEGIAPGTMYQIKKNSKSETRNSKQIKIITAWKYPGRSPIRGPVPIPADILEELSKIK